jgi:phage gpG-like protein
VVNISVEVEDAKLNSALTKLAGQFGNARPALRAGARVMAGAARENIASRGRSSGHPYPPHAPATLRAIASTNRRGVRSAGELLNATGRLLQSVGTFGGPDSIFEETDDSLTIGTRVPYARFHQTGTRRMPRRPIYVTSPRVVREVGREVRNSYRDGIKPLGFEYSESEGAAF